MCGRLGRTDLGASRSTIGPTDDPRNIKHYFTVQEMCSVELSKYSREV